MKHWKIALALLLPLAALAAGIVRSERALATATPWAIPITGYDPRDPLRGHYIQFRYDWKVVGEAGLCRDGGCLICLRRSDGGVEAEIMARDTNEACPDRVDPVASHISPEFASRIFVSETSAPELEEALRSRPMEVLALLRRDGRLINRALRARGETAE
jgi:hypothetical protein